MSIVLNGLTFSLALGFLLIILWHDAWKEQNQIFALFLVFSWIWNISAGVVQISQLGIISDFVPEWAVFALEWAVGGVEIGFAAASIMLYLFINIILGFQTRRLRYLTLITVGLLTVYRLFLIVNGNTEITLEQLEVYRFQPMALIVFLLFDVLTFFLAWRFRRRISSNGLLFGIGLFLLGQSLVIINPDFVVISVSASVSSMGIVIICFSIIRRDLINPLSERMSQIETMHTVTLSVTSQIAIDTLLSEIVEQAVEWVDADGSAIFLASETEPQQVLKLVAVHNIPDDLLDGYVDVPNSMVDFVVKSGTSYFAENYARDWRGGIEFPYAADTFGSVICVPLLYSHLGLGALMVISGKQGRVFAQREVRLLEMLGTQAAVAIAHSQLFNEQQVLNEQVRSAKSQLETVLVSTDNPVIAINLGKDIVFANRAAWELIPSQGIEDNAALRMHIIDRLDFDGPNASKQFGQELDVFDRTYLCQVAEMDDVIGGGMVVVMHDITQLKELDRMKSEMVRMASHDLKNPLMGAMTHIDLVRDDLADNDLDAVRSSVDTIETQLQRMNRIISGVLDVERIRGTELIRERISPDDLVTDALDELSSVLTSKSANVAVHVDKDLPFVNVDREQMHRVLVNLLENAIKFSLDDVKIEIDVRDCKDRVEFVISDKGVGIPHEIQARIFDRFFRGKQDQVGHVTGTGLGLSLVKSIIEAHGGNITLDSDGVVGHGTKFCITLPVM